MDFAYCGMREHMQESVFACSCAPTRKNNKGRVIILSLSPFCSRSHTLTNTLTLIHAFSLLLLFAHPNAMMRSLLSLSLLLTGVQTSLCETASKICTHFWAIASNDPNVACENLFNFCIFIHFIWEEYFGRLEVRKWNEFGKIWFNISHLETIKVWIDQSEQKFIHSRSQLKIHFSVLPD